MTFGAMQSKTLPKVAQPQVTTHKASIEPFKPNSSACRVRVARVQIIRGYGMPRSFDRRSCVRTYQKEWSPGLEAGMAVMQ